MGAFSIDNVDYFFRLQVLINGLKELYLCNKLKERVFIILHKKLNFFLFVFIYHLKNILRSLYEVFIVI